MTSHTAAIGDLIVAGIKEPGIAAPAVVSHTLRVGMGRAFGEHAWVHKAVDGWCARRTWTGSTLVDGNTLIGYLVDDRSLRAFAASYALLGANRVGVGAVWGTSGPTFGELLTFYWAHCGNK